MASDSQVRKRKDKQKSDVQENDGVNDHHTSERHSLDSAAAAAARRPASTSKTAMVLLVLAAALCASVLASLLYMQMSAPRPVYTNVPDASGKHVNELPPAQTIWQLEGSEPEPILPQQHVVVVTAGDQQPQQPQQQVQVQVGPPSSEQRRVRVRQVIKVHTYPDGRVAEEVVSEEVIEGASEEELDAGTVVEEASPEVLEKLGDLAGASRLRASETAATESSSSSGDVQSATETQQSQVHVSLTSEPPAEDHQTSSSQVINNEHASARSEPETQTVVVVGGEESSVADKQTVEEGKSASSPPAEPRKKSVKSADTAETESAKSVPKNKNKRDADRADIDGNEREPSQPSPKSPVVEKNAAKRPAAKNERENTSGTKSTAKTSTTKSSADASNTIDTAGSGEPRDNVKEEPSPPGKLGSPSVKPASSDQETKLAGDAEDIALLHEADDIVDTDPAAALSAYNHVLARHDRSPPAMWGRARCLSHIASQLGSRSHRERAVETYRQLLSLSVSSAMYRDAVTACVSELKSLGQYERAIRLLQQAIQRVPDELALRNSLTVLFMTLNQYSAAIDVISETLRLWPDCGFAKAHLGFIRKQQGRLSEAVELLQAGLDSNEEGVHDVKFYHFLGDALYRLGEHKRSTQVYGEAVSRGLFPSFFQRSIYNVAGLKAQPLWSAGESGASALISELESNWREIRDELNLLLTSRRAEDGFRAESEHLTRSGRWLQYELFSRASWRQYECVKTPVTCRLVSRHSVVTSCRRCQVKFSIIDRGTRVWAHTGPTNCRLRAHLGLMVPPAGAAIRIANITRTWREGEVIVFDDSFEHEVWNEGDGARAVLIVDFWHPHLSDSLRSSLPAV